MAPAMSLPRFPEICVRPELEMAPTTVNTANGATDPREGATAPKTCVVVSNRIVKIVKVLMVIKI
jgi:hypothetical protein